MRVARMNTGKRISARSTQKSPAAQNACGASKTKTKPETLLTTHALQRRPLPTNDLVQRNPAVLQIALRVVRELLRRHACHVGFSEHRQILRRIGGIGGLHSREH